MRLVACRNASRQNFGRSRGSLMNIEGLADGGEALFPLLGEGFHGPAEVGERVAGGEVAADAACHFHLVWLAAGGGHRGAKGLEFSGLRPAERVEAVRVSDYLAGPV